MPCPVSDFSALLQHLYRRANEAECYRPVCCKHCGRAGLWHHGCYERKPRCRETTHHLNPIPIARFFCRFCRRTCSVLPSCLSPRRCYAWAVQQLVLVVVLTGHGDEAAAQAGGVHPSTAARWRRWLQRRHERFSFAVRQHWPALGYNADWRAFWCHCLAQWGLSDAMRRLLVDGLTVP